MNDSVKPPICFAAMAALLVGLVAGIFGTDAGNPSKSIDDWRRTPAGWERRSAWIPGVEPAIAHRRVELAAANSRRLDTHPAALALLQLVSALLSLAVFSPRGRLLLNEKSLSVLLARSFRASVFGS